MAATQKRNNYNELNRFYNILKPDKKDISAIYIFALLIGLVQLSLPLGIQTIINFVMAGSMSTSIVVLIILVVIGTFLNGLLQVRQLEIIEKLKQKIFLRYAFDFSNRLPRLNIERLDNYYLPELVNRFFDTVSLQKGIEKILLDLPAAMIQILFGVLLLSFYHPVFIALGALLILIVLLILKFTYRQGLRFALEASSYKYNVAAWLQELARVVKSFKYAKESSLHMDKTDEQVSGYLEARTSYFRILLIQFWSLISFKVIITAAMLILGSLLLTTQQINIGQFIAADIVIIAIINSVEKLIISLDRIYDTLVSVEKLAKVTDGEIELSGNTVLPSTNTGVAIQFKEVNFCYNNDKDILHDLSFSILPGSIAKLSGKSGTGKSTVLRLLTGSFTEFSGQILIDGMPVNSYHLESLRSQTGVLLSSQDIFHGTLLENITLGNTLVSTDEILSLANKTGFDTFIQSDKNGLSTVLDPLGNKLPRHIKQHILLMRALLGNHRLLLLEEPFEYLDQQTTEAFAKILSAKKQSTIIIASNDKIVDAISDTHILMENGYATIKNN